MGKAMGNTRSYEDVLAEDGVLCYRTVGGSMLPLIRTGKDVVIIKPPKGRLGKYDVALFKRPSATGTSAYVLHRVLRVNSDGTYWIVGDNCSSGETVAEENVIGVLTEVRGSRVQSERSRIEKLERLIERMGERSRGEGCDERRDESCSKKLERLIERMGERRRGENRNRASGLRYWLYVHTWCACWPLRFLILRARGIACRSACRFARGVRNFARERDRV